MKTLRYILLGLFLFTAGLYAQDPAAMVTAVDGDATVETSGVTKALEIGMELAPGAIVNVAGGGASLVFMSGDLMELAAGDILTLGSDMESSTLSGAEGTRGVGQQDGVTVAEEGIGKANTDKWQSQLAYIYGVRGDASVVPVAPRLAIASPRPVFYWFDGDSTKQGDSRTYTLTLKDGSGKTLLTKDVPGNVYRLNSYSPESLPAGFMVEPGKRYTWSVVEKGEQADGSEAAFIYIDEAGLQLAAAKEKRMSEMQSAKTINSQSYHTIMAMYYLDERERLFSDAIPHLLALAETPGGRTYAGTQMALLLNRFGNELSAAAAYYARMPR